MQKIIAGEKHGTAIAVLLNHDILIGKVGHDRWMITFSVHSEDAVLSYLKQHPGADWGALNTQAEKVTASVLKALLTTENIADEIELLFHDRHSSLVAEHVLRIIVEQLGPTYKFLEAGL